MPDRDNSQRNRGKRDDSEKNDILAPVGGQNRAKKRPFSAPKTKIRGQISGPQAVISRRAADRLQAGHVWVYRSDVERIVPPADDSKLLQVLDSRGLSLGTALYSDSSQIALRLVSPAPLTQSSWLTLFRERLRKALAFRKEILKAETGRTDACRLVFSEADGLPGLVADKYGDLIILQLLTQGMARSDIRAAFAEIAAEMLAPAAIFERTDERIRDLEQLDRTSDAPLYVAAEGGPTSPSESTIFQLNGLRFQYDANSGQKTGAFLDQRENYAAAALYCRGEALDVCTYQGGFALHLARQCQKVTGVDASLAALEVAEQNHTLNRQKLGNVDVEWIEANAFDLLREWSTTGVRFDSIVLDPPAFAKSQKATEGALRGYKELNLRALKMLRPGGTLVTCSCSHHVGVEDFTEVVRAAAADARRQVRLLERRGASADHPVLLNVPETEYLKCLICRVD